VREDFTQQAAHQVPQITRPHPLYGVAAHELRKNGVYPVAKTAQPRAPFGRGISFLGGVGGQKLYTHLRQLFFGLGRVVVAVPDEHTSGPLGEFGDDRELVSVGRSDRNAGDHPWPADPRVYPKAVEGLFEEGVLAEGGFSFETLAAVGSGEQARRQGERVRQGEAGVVRGLSQEALPEALLGLPQVRRLPGEGGAMHSPEVREEVGVVAPEVSEEFGVFVEPQELADDLDGEDFRVGERGSGSAGSEVSEVLESVVDEAEDGYDEGAKIHESEDLLLTSAVLGATERREVSLFIQPFGETCTWG
jgi:hypothetical protein